MNKEIAAVEAKMDGIEQLTIEQDIEQASGGDETKKKLLKEFWRLVGAKETETVFELTEISLEEATKKIENESPLGWWLWYDEDRVVVWNDYWQVAEIIAGRGNWTLNLTLERGGQTKRQYWENKEGDSWIEPDGF